MKTQTLTGVAGSLFLLVCAGTLARADVAPSAGMLRWPDISKDRICFVYANDIWTAPKAGGVASPLASPPGLESFPRFSADGQTIAFVGNYEGNRDLYTIPLAGGIPTRVTYHPAGETLADWTPDGKLLFMTNGFAGLARQTQLWTTPAAGGLPTKVPVPYAGFGSISPDSTWLAYTLHSTDTRTWKRYRGGMATDVWLFNLKDSSSKKITDWEGTDTLPMWVTGGDGSVVYYLSDNGPEHRLNIWRYTLATGQREQVTKYAADDVRWPSIGPGNEGSNTGEIIFQLGAELRVVDLATGQDRVVKVTIPGDRPTIKPRTIDASKYITNASMSPSGKRVTVEARGDVWTLPAKEGVVRNLTRTDGVFDRAPSYSPDGKTIAYFSDAEGEYDLYLRPSDAQPVAEKSDKKKDDADADESAQSNPVPSEALPKAVRKLTNLGPGYRFGPVWSPDSKQLLTTDQTGAMLLINAESGEVKTIDKDPSGNPMLGAFSHDSAWLVYARSDDANTQGCIWLYELATGNKTQVTASMFNSYSPTFDRKGEFIYFLSNRSISGPVYSDIDNSFAYTDTVQAFAIPLRAGVKSPLAPKADEESFKVEKPKEEKKDEGKEADKPAEGEKKEPAKDDKAEAKKTEKKPIAIDTTEMESRTILLPIRSGNLYNLVASESGKLLYVRRDAVRDDEGPSGGSIKVFDLAADEKKEETVAEADGFDISPDGKKLLFIKGGEIFICEPAKDAKKNKVPTGGMNVTINPRNEWKQILAETSRVQRDYFYEPTLHGVDWKSISAHYAKMVDDAVTREDVAWIQAELISELNIGHAYVSAPGDVENPPQVSCGMLGCDFMLDTSNAGAPRYQFGTIYRGAAWDADAVGPLDAPGVKVDSGDYLLAVNGVEIDASKDPWAAFQGLAGKTVSITVSKSLTLDAQARDYIVKLLGSETNLRYRAFIEAKRAFVEKVSGGKVGYIYVPNTGVDGQNDLYRQFYGQRHKAALIIDERWNGGGQIPTRFIELLNRPVTNYWAKRDSNDWTWPPDSHQGPKCMLANGLAGSGGDMFPWLFKYNKLGPVIGTRTWGGLVGISGNPGMIDGGYISVPTFGFYEKDGTWGVEGHGTDPDIEVIDDPALMQRRERMYSVANYNDPQLDRAISEMLKAIAERPYVKPQRPASPNRSGMGIDPKDH